MHIFLLTGEPSGDLHGARLAQAMQALAPSVTLSGAGGARMRDAGVRLVAESEHWGAIGIPDAVRKIPGLLREMKKLKALLRADPPDVLVCIDFGAFNVRLLRELPDLPSRKVYYIPPGSWSRQRKAGQLPFLVDIIATPFPWSAENLRAAGASARIDWVGHPILDYCQAATPRAEARQQLGVAEEQPVVLLAPGSRRSELHYLLDVFLTTVARLTPAPCCLLSVAPSLGEAAVQHFLTRHATAGALDIRLMRGFDHALVRAADGALVASGTATLELACLDIPMVVAYRGSFATWVQYKIVARGGRLRFIALPNILADAPVVPERLQHAANPDTLAADLAPLLTDTPARQAQRAAFAAIRANLGDGHAVEKTARLVLGRT